jgi:hypothetical protein
LHVSIVTHSDADTIYDPIGRARVIDHAFSPPHNSCVVNGIVNTIGLGLAIKTTVVYAGIIVLRSIKSKDRILVVIGAPSI